MTDQKPREFWIDPNPYDEDHDNGLYDAIRNHPRQGPLEWQASLIHVIEHSAYEYYKARARQIESVANERATLLGKYESEIEKLRAENERFRRALIKVSEGCPTKYKGCTYLENTALIALAGHDEFGDKALRGADDLPTL